MKIFKKISLPKDYSSLLQWVSYLWAGTICFPSLQGTFYGVFALLLWGVFRGHLGFSFNYRRCLSDGLSLSKSDSTKGRIVSKAEECIKAPVSFWKSRKTPFYFLLAYLLWMSATIFWSDDIREYFRQFEKLIPLYLLAFIGFMEGIEKHININKVLNAFLWGVLIAIGYMVVCMGVDMFVGDAIANVKVYGLLSINLIEYISHRTYIGIVLLCAIPILIGRLGQATKGHGVVVVLLIGFIAFLSISSGARILSLLLIAVIVSSFLIIWGKRINWWVKVVFVISVLGVVSVVAMSNNTFKTKLYQIKQNVDIEEVEGRVYLWRVATDLYLERPIVGYGLGDVEKLLIDEYTNRDYSIAAQRKLNAHNQYLQILLSGGLVGLILFLLFVLTFIYRCSKGSVNSKKMLISVFLIFGITAFVESIFARNIGVLPFVFFIFILSLVSAIGNSVRNYRNDRLYGITVITLLFFFLASISVAFGIPKNRTQAQTCFTGTYHVLAWKEIPSKEGLPCECNGVVYSLNVIKDLGVRSGKNYIQNDVYRADLSSQDTTDIYFSVWCYVPVESTLSAVTISVYDVRNSFGDKYDMNNKGVWQQLKIKEKSNLEYTRFYTMVISEQGQVSVNSKAFLALPELSINNKALMK